MEVWKHTRIDKTLQDIERQALFQAYCTATQQISRLYLRAMKSHSLRLTIFSLLGLSTAQTPSSSPSSSSTATPFALTLSTSSSRESLIPSTPTSAIEPSIRRPPPIQTGVSRNSSFVLTESATSTTTTSKSTWTAAPRSSGAADTRGKKMGVVGVLAGAAGVLFV